MLNAYTHTHTTTYSSRNICAAVMMKDMPHDAHTQRAFESFYRGENVLSGIKHKIKHQYSENFMAFLCVFQHTPAPEAQQQQQRAEALTIAEHQHPQIQPQPRDI